jgi:dienelactone hydrolase
MALGNGDEQRVRFEVRDRGEWEGFTRYHGAMRRGNRSTPALLLVPVREEGACPCVVAIHGFEERKETWLDVEGYTKGGRVSQGLLHAGVGVLAVDMYGHGEQREEGFSGPYPALINEQWETFFAQGQGGIEDALAYVSARVDLDATRTGLLSYSLGGVFAFYVADVHGGMAALAACAPPAFWEDDDQYAPYNHVEGLAEVPVLVVGAARDEELDFEDVRWLYEQLPGEDKRFVTYDSGHSLPAAHADQVVTWFERHLRC